MAPRTPEVRLGRSLALPVAPNNRDTPGTPAIDRIRVVGYFWAMIRSAASFGLLLLAVAVGCAPLAKRGVGPRVPSDPRPPIELPPLPEPEILQVGGKADLPEPPPPKSRNILVLSGGGSYGAYSAGVVCGWTRAGNRPVFDVVTGVSTGALIAPLAFLGAEGDADLQKFYTQVRAKDVFTLRSFATVPFRDAAANTAPLRKIVAGNLTPERVEAIAAAHRKGRRLLIGTTNLETKRFVVWDFGAIANKGGPNARQLMTDILIASCSVPGVFPPVPVSVEIDGRSHTELHVDGGVAAPMFLPSKFFEVVAPRDRTDPPANLYVVVAGKFFPDPAPVKPRVLKVLEASVGAFFTGHARAEVANLYHLSKLYGVRFGVTAVPESLAAPDSGIDFDIDAMNRLFTAGLEVGLAGKFATRPPERSPGDATYPRTGTTFRTPSGESSR